MAILMEDTYISKQMPKIPDLEKFYKFFNSMMMRYDDRSTEFNNLFTRYLLLKWLFEVKPINKKLEEKYNTLDILVTEKLLTPSELDQLKKAPENCYSLEIDNWIVLLLNEVEGDGYFRDRKTIKKLRDEIIVLNENFRKMKNTICTKKTIMQKICRYILHTYSAASLTGKIVEVDGIRFSFFSHSFIAAIVYQMTIRLIDCSREDKI